MNSTNTPNTTYKIGDYVVVRNDLIAGNNYAMTNDPAVTHPVTDDMLAFSALVVRISSFDENSNAYHIDHPVLDDNDTVWTDDMFMGTVSVNTATRILIGDIFESMRDVTDNALKKIRADENGELTNNDLMSELTSIIYYGRELSKMTGIKVDA